MIITIDGPVASGKSTAARNLAARLGWEYLDTGAIYRAVTLLAERRGVDPSDREAVRRLLDGADIEIDGTRVRAAGEDVTEEIRTPEITNGVRPFAENPDVRRFVRDLERERARGRDIVVEGRDMGTAVFPEAELKIYLTATPEERARRRWEEHRERGTPQDYEQVLAELCARDQADMNREISPLKKPDDAVVVDSTGWESSRTADELASIVREKVGAL